MRSRNDREKAQRRETLLNASQVVFFSKGFENTSMDDIANEAGFSRALLYVYFKDKKDIYQALKIRAVKKMRNRMIDYVSKVKTGAEKVAAVGHAFYDFYRYDKNYFDCLSLNITLSNQSSSSTDKIDVNDDAIENEKLTMQVMLDSLATGIADGTLDKDRIGDPLETAMFLRGSLHGMILLQDRDGSALLNTAGVDREKLVMRGIERITSSLIPQA